MELNSYTRNIKDILTLKKTYVIPRFQREYSWGIDELETLWKDICESIKYEQNNYIANDYFFGSLVLIGKDSQDTRFLVVDGQQRLTTITIFLSVLSKKFGELGENGLRDRTFEYIKSKDVDDIDYLVLESESPKPYFQYRIQDISLEENTKPETEEEIKIEKAYEFFLDMLSRNKLEQIFKKEVFDYLKILKIIRDQILRFSTIYITVTNEDDAYLIFETLNAKGKDLTPVDLIKNKIFKSIPSDRNFDKPKEKWKKIKSNLKRRNKSIDISIFFRHFWLAKYDFVTEGKLYNSFLKKIPKDNREEYLKLLNELEEFSKIYCMIVNADENDWKQVEEKSIYNSINAINIFNVSQVNTIIMALIKVRNEKLISFGRFKLALKELEKFHFLFTAVTHSRPSGLESKYSRYARNICNATTKEEVHNELDKLIVELNEKIPSEQLFIEKFFSIKYKANFTKEKKLIQYMFRKMEEYYRDTQELKINIISIEHLMSESTHDPHIGFLGNLIPFDKELNTKMGNKPYKEKVAFLIKSELKTVEEFIITNGDKEEWTKEDIIKRTEEIGKLFYEEIWR